MVSKEELEKQKAVIAEKIADLQIEMEKYFDMQVKVDDVKETGIKLGGHKIKDSNAREVTCKIKANTPKALLVVYNNKEAWIPRSTVMNEYTDNVPTMEQVLIIANWIYEQKWGG